MERVFGQHGRWSFRAKLAAAALLTLAADVLLYGTWAGSVLGGFAALWALATVAVHPAVRRDRRALGLVGLAALFAGALAFDPGLLAWVLFWSALGMAVLLPRSPAFGDAWQWGWRLVLHGLTSLLGPITDAMRLRKARKRRSGSVKLGPILAMLILPTLGGLVFLALFAEANPVISDMLARISFPDTGHPDIPRILFSLAILVTVWASLRPRRLRLRVQPLQQGAEWTIPGVTVASVTLSLILFNAMFAAQNALDIAFLWSGAPLPDGMSLAEYAHRGAYPLIATALLAGGFVLLTTQPGSAMAGNPLIRRLVALWVAQNVFLVASSILRTLDYIAVYSLTQLRIAALLWMALVALGLVLITIRMLRGKSLGWLVNANVLATLALLSIGTVADLGATSAQWNVRHAREAGGAGTFLDLCYLNYLDGSALLPLAELEQRPSLNPLFRDQVSRVRQEVEQRVRRQQTDWRSWEARDAMRLARLPQGLRAMPVPKGYSVACDGDLFNRLDSAPDLPTSIG